MKGWPCGEKTKVHLQHTEGADEVQRKSKQTVGTLSWARVCLTHKRLSVGLKINLAEQLHLQSRLVDAIYIPSKHKRTRKHKHMSLLLKKCSKKSD